MHLVLKDDQLLLEELTALVPISPREFQAEDEEFRLVFVEANGGRPDVRVLSDEGEEELFEPVDEFQPSAAELRAFEGEYYSDDAETTLILSVTGGELVLHRRPGWTVTLSPEYADTFDAPELGLIRFHRDARGRVAELSLRQSRVYDMRFPRVSEPESR
jgi:hypothetical protein